MHLVCPESKHRDVSVHLLFIHFFTYSTFLGKFTDYKLQSLQNSDVAVIYSSKMVIATIWAGLMLIKLLDQQLEKYENNRHK